MAGAFDPIGGVVGMVLALSATETARTQRPELAVCRSALAALTAVRLQEIRFLSDHLAR